MRRVRLTSLNDFAEWRLAARALLLQGTHPEDVVWEDPAASVDLFAEPEERPADVATRAVGVVPPRFIELAEAAICHREPIRFGLLYRLLFRLQKDRDLIEVRSDPDISKLYRLASEVRRDSHKMKAFVRFREDEDALRRLVRAGPLHARADGAVFRAPVRRRCSGRSSRPIAPRPGMARRCCSVKGRASRTRRAPMRWRMCGAPISRRSSIRRGSRFR